MTHGKGLHNPVNPGELELKCLTLLDSDLVLLGAMLMIQKINGRGGEI